MLCNPHRNKRVWFSLLVVVTVFSLQGLLFLHWGISVDDYGPLANNRVHSLKEFFALFYGNDNFSLMFPSNYHVHEQVFLNVYYRPLMRLFFAMQTPFFGAYPLGYFLIMVLFHALTSMLIFNIFLTLVGSYFWSLWGALFFAFHITTGGWLGWIAALHYPISHCFILLACILFFQSLKRPSTTRYLLSGLCYLIAIFSFEGVCFFPIFITSLCCILPFLTQTIGIQPIGTKRYVQKSTVFWLGLGTYLVTRATLYPIDIVRDPNVKTFSTFFSLALSRWYSEATTFLVDFTNIYLIPAPWHLAKAVVFALVAMACIWRFMKSPYKKVIMLLAVNMGLFMWTAFMRCMYRPRFVYFAIPLYIMIFFLLFVLPPKLWLCKRWPRLLPCLCSSLLLANLWYVLGSLKHRERETNATFAAYQDLATHQQLHGKTLCFIGFPHQYFCAGLAQGVWIRGINKQLPIYYDLRTSIMTNLSNDPGLVIQPVPNGLHLTLTNTACGGFAPVDQTPMGTCLVRARHPLSGNPTELVWIVDKIYRNQPLFFVGWDFTQQKFKPLGFLLHQNT
jgi:hypothetical protein